MYSSLSFGQLSIALFMCLWHQHVQCVQTVLFWWIIIYILILSWLVGWFCYLHRFSESRSSSGSTPSVRPSETVLGCLVCVICNFNSFYSFLFKFCIMIFYTLKMCTFYFVNLSWYFFTFFGGFELRHFSIQNA